MEKMVLSILSIIMLIMGCVGSPSPESTSATTSTTITEGMTLDQAIAEAALRIEERIVAGSKIALLNFNSTSDRFSAYVLDELTANLVENGKLIVVDRSEIDLIRGEFDFQYSGEVGDDSMQALGQILGAQSIISGSLTDMGGFYRIMIRVLNVQNASVEVQYRTNIVSDHVVAALLTGGRSSRTTTISTPTGQTGQTTQTQQTVQVPSQQIAQTSTIRTTVYRIGDTGPAGGIIFFDKGIFSNGWRYLEASPAEYEIIARWGLQAIRVNTSTDIGGGKTNTENLVLMIRERGELDRAAELCTILEINGFNDWFLPSRDELDLLYKNLKQQNLGDFKNTYYVSSTAPGDSGNSVYIQHFGRGGSPTLFSRNQEVYNVRAVRQF